MMCYDYFIVNKKKNMNIKSQLFELGLDEKEAELYELLLKCGASSISQILKSTKIKKGDLYNILYRLMEKNLIEKKNNLFIVFNPEALANLLQKEKQNVINKENIIASVLPKLNEVYENSSNEIVFQSYKEKAEIKKYYLQILQSNKKKSFFFTDLNLFYDYFYSNLNKINRAKVKIIISLEIKKENINVIKKFLKIVKSFPKNIELSFLTISHGFIENLISFDNEVCLLKKSQNLSALKIVNKENSQFYLNTLTFISKYSFDLKDLLEILGLLGQVIVLKDDNLFSKKFLQKNKKLLSEELLEKLNLLK